MVNLTVLLTLFCVEDFVGALIELGDAFVELGNSMMLDHSSLVCKLLLDFSDQETRYLSGEITGFLFLDEGCLFFSCQVVGHVPFVFGRIIVGTQVEFESCDRVSPESCCSHSHLEMIAPEAGFTFPATGFER